MDVLKYQTLNELKKNKGKDRVSKVSGGHMDAIEKLF